MPKNTDVKTMTETPVSIKDMILNTWKQEHETTMRLLKAYPEDKLDLKPHEKLRNARDIAWTIVINEPWMINGILTGQFAGDQQMKAPATMREIISNFEKHHRETLEKVTMMNDKDLDRNVKFFVGPKQMGDVKIKDLLSMIILDQVHHRGQLSVYLRMAGGRVPSIYGPTADEDWM